MSIDIEQFHGVFFDESDEHLDDMEQLLMSLDVESPDPEELNSIFRAAHSIKGGSGIFGFDALMNLTHVMENLLDKARNNELSVTADIVNVLLETLDVLKDTLNAYRDETPVPEDSIAERIKILNGVINGQSTDATSGDGDDSSEVSVNAQNESAQDDSFGFFDDEPNRLLKPLTTVLVFSTTNQLTKRSLTATTLKVRIMTMTALASSMMKYRIIQLAHKLHRLKPKQLK